VCVKVASPHADAVLVLVPHPDDDDAGGDAGVLAPSWAELRARLRVVVAGGDGGDGAPRALAVLVLPGARATRPRDNALAEVAARLSLASLEGVDSFVADLTDPGRQLPGIASLPAAELDALLAWVLGRGVDSSAGAVLASAAFRHAWWERVRDHGALRSAEELAVFQCAAVAPRSLKVWFVETVVAALGAPERVWAAYLADASALAAATSAGVLPRLSEHILRAALPRLLATSVCTSGQVEPTTMGAFAERFLQAVRWSDTSVRLASGARGLAALREAAVDARDWASRMGQAARALAASARARVQARAREWPAREFRHRLGLPEAASEAAQWVQLAERLESLEFRWVAVPGETDDAGLSLEGSAIISELGRFLAANGGSEAEALPALKALVGEDTLSDAAEAGVLECHFMWQLVAHLLLSGRMSEMDRVPLFASPPSAADLEDWDLRWAHELRLGEPGRSAAIARLAPPAAGSGRTAKRLRPSAPEPEDGGSPRSESELEAELDGGEPPGPLGVAAIAAPLCAAVESELEHGRCFEDLLKGALDAGGALAPVVVAAVLSPKRSSRADVSRHEARAREAAFNSVLVRASSFQALPLFP
jgi:hypothetical protein